MADTTLPSDDDEGPLIGIGSSRLTRNAGRKPAVKNRVLKRPRNQKASTSAVEAAGNGLPPDDDGPGLDIPMHCRPARDPPTQQPSSGPIHWLKYDDDTLKAAAAKIPSQVSHPYPDLPCELHKPNKELCDTVWEIFSLPRLQPMITEMGGTCRRSYDIKNFWDLGQESLQRTLLADLCILQPVSIFLSPPCTWVCALQHSNWSRMPRAKRVPNLMEALNFIDMGMWAATFQVQGGRLFAFEHPLGSLAWERDSATCHANNSKCSLIIY